MSITQIVHRTKRAKIPDMKHPVFVALLTILSASAVLAQPHALPSKDGAVCSTCMVPNRGKRTPAVPDPLRFVGRFVDSANTGNAQNMGIRTVRAQRVRFAGDRIYVEYGEAVAAFSRAQFFAAIRQPLSPVGVLRTGNTVRRYEYPVEKVAAPSTFFYAEARSSGWSFAPLDLQEVISDFDADGTGNVVVGTHPWGWGIARDANAFADTRLMTFVSQVKDTPIVPYSVISIAPYAIISTPVVTPSATSLLVYNVNEPARPRVTSARKGRENAIITWAKDERTRRVAVVNGASELRVYGYDAMITGGAPLYKFSPAPRKTFRDVVFDENGTLWAVEAYRLWQITPDGKSTMHDLGNFAPERVAVRRSLVVIGGYAARNKTEVHMYRLASSGLQEIETQDFFFRYYHDKAPPAGIASASAYLPAYTSLMAVNLIEHDGKLFLIYSANGLGDVYEIATGAVIEPPKEPTPEPCVCTCPNHPPT